MRALHSRSCRGITLRCSLRFSASHEASGMSPASQHCSNTHAATPDAATSKEAQARKRAAHCAAHAHTARQRACVLANRCAACDTSQALRRLPQRQALRSFRYALHDFRASKRHNTPAHFSLFFKTPAATGAIWRGHSASSSPSEPPPPCHPPPRPPPPECHSYCPPLSSPALLPQRPTAVPRWRCRQAAYLRTLSCSPRLHAVARGPACVCVCV